MKKITLPFFLLAGLAFAQCSTKKEDAAPVSPFPANSASVTVDGVAFPVDITRTVAIVNAQTGELGFSLNTSDPRGPFVAVRVAEFRYRTERIQFMPGSPSSVVVGAGFAPGAGSDYDTNLCSTKEQAIEIVAVDQVNKMVSVRFSGTACGGNNGAQQKIIRDGQVNLPYTVR